MRLRSFSYGKLVTFNDILLAELLDQVANKCPIAFGRVYEITRRPLTCVAMAVLHCVPDAEEVICDSLMYVWQHADRFERTRGSPMAWLGTIVRRRSIDLFRKRTHCVNFEDHLADAVSASLESIPTPDELMLKFDDVRCVRTALMHLSPVRQTVLRLAYFDDMTHQEIADALNIPSGTVKSNIRRGLSSMQSFIIEAVSHA